MIKVYIRKYEGNNVKETEKQSKLHQTLYGVNYMDDRSMTAGSRLVLAREILEEHDNPSIDLDDYDSVFDALSDYQIEKEME